MKTLLLALAVVLAPSLVHARQYAAGNGHVVHTRRAPVVLHRAVPPFKGVHVYESGRR